MPKRRGHTPRGQTNHPIVGIGASAGGLNALLAFFDALPSHTSMAFVVVVHLAPGHESNLASLLGKATDMPVVEVTSATPIEADHVYVITPSLDLAMVDDYLRVSPSVPQEGRRAAIDVFSARSPKRTASAPSASCSPARVRTAPPASRA